MAGFDLGNSNDAQLDSNDAVQMMTPKQDPTSAAFELGWQDTPVGAIARLMANSDAESAGGTKLQPADLNEKYPMPEKFQEPMTERMAGMLYNRYQNRQRLQEAVDTGSQSFSDRIINGAAGMLPHFIDPLNVGGTLLTAGVANALGAGALAGKAAYAASVGENLVGNAMWQPLVASANKAEGRDYTVADVFQNVIAPSVVFPALHLGGRQLFRYAGLLDSAGTEAAHAGAVGALADNRDPRVALDMYKKQLVTETSGKDFMPYQFDALNQERPFYAASKTVNTPLGKAEKALIGEEFGPGTVTLSDNPNVANGSAARAGYSSAGTVHEVNLSGAKLLQLTEADIDKASMKDGGLEALKADAIAQGYDGITYAQTKVLGEDHPPHNVVALFNQEAAQEKSMIPADSSKVPKLSEDEMSQMANRRLDPQSNLEDRALMMDKEGQKMAEEIGASNPELNQSLADMRGQTDAGLEQLREMNELGQLDHGDLKELNEITKLKAKESKVPLASAQALACVRGG